MGNLHYAFRYSQTAEFGSSMGDWQTATPSVSLDYASENQRHPFNLNYSGGYTWTLAGPSYSTLTLRYFRYAARRTFWFAAVT